MTNLAWYAKPANNIDALLDAPERHVDLPIGQRQAGRQAEPQGGERAAQVLAADHIGLAGAAVAPQRQLAPVDPLVAVDVRVAGPQPRLVGAAVDAYQPAVAQPDRRAGLAVQPGRARRPKAAPVVFRDRVVDRPVGA